MIRKHVLRTLVHVEKTGRRDIEEPHSYTHDRCVVVILAFQVQANECRNDLIFIVYRLRRIVLKPPSSIDSRQPFWGVSSTVLSVALRFTQA